MFFQSVVCAHITIVAECQTNTKSSEHVHPSHMCLEQTIVLTRHIKIISSEQFSSQEQRAKCKVPAGITSPYHTIQKTAKARSKLKGSVAYSSAAAESCCQGTAVSQETRKHQQENENGRHQNEKKRESAYTETRKNEKTRKTRKCEMLRKPCVLLQNMKNEKNEKREKTRKNENWLGH